LDIVYILILAILFAAVLGVGWVRLAPLPAQRFLMRPGPMSAGKHLLDGGAKVVVPLSDLPQEPLTHLAWIIGEEPRSDIFKDREHHLAIVSRSRRIGFPDITLAWVDEDCLHIHGHLVYGKYDFGVNARRIQHWLHLLNTLEDEQEIEDEEEFENDQEIQPMYG